MTDPTKIIDRQAERMYEAWLLDTKRHAWNPFTGKPIQQKAWPELDNHTRERWRDRALAALRSEESVLDELKREDRERLAALAIQDRAPDEGQK